MSTIAQKIHQEAARLPESLAVQVYDFICFIEARHGIEPAAGEPLSRNWDEFFERHSHTVADAKPLNRDELYADRSLVPKLPLGNAASEAPASRKIRHRSKTKLCQKMKNPPPARIHLLPAKATPYVVVIRRKPTQWFHVLRWNTETDAIEHGSWFKGTLYPERADVSFNGEWMIYFALGAGEEWSGLCHPPWLKTIVDVPNFGTRYGGGYWETEAVLKVNGGPYSSWPKLTREARVCLPFRIEEHVAESYPEGWETASILPARLRRDGWSLCPGDHDPGEQARGKAAGAGNPTWRCRPTDQHPTLRMEYVGYRKKDPRLPFRFRLDEHPGLIPDTADWACWDALGQLIFTDHGVLHKYPRGAIAARRPTTTIDLEHLTPHPTTGTP